MKFSQLLWLLLAALLLAGCGPSAPAETTAPSGAPTAPAMTPAPDTTPATSPAYTRPTYAGVPEKAPDGPPVKSLKLAGNDIALYKIVLPADAIPAEQTAAAELAKYIELATGVKLKTAASAGHAILLRVDESGELGKEGFLLSFEGNSLVITGGRSRGILFGVYTFLEEYIGCRFYTDDCERILKADAIDVPASLHDRQLPGFDVRYIWYTHLSASLQAKLRAVPTGLPDEARGDGNHFAGPGGHAMAHWVPILKYPELYEKGGLCLSNPRTFEIVKASVRDALANDPDARLVSLSPDDTDSGYCRCEACNAVNEAEGSKGAMHLCFVNDIARDIAKDYPNVLVNMYAYLYTQKRPKTIRPEPNVQVQLCTEESCLVHSLEDPDCESNVAFMTILKEWAAVTNHLAIYDYTTSFDNYIPPFPNLAALFLRTKTYAAYNVEYFLAEGIHTTENGEFSELKVYLLSKVLWNPSMTKEEYYAHMDDFLEGYYGAGWQNIRAYIDYVQTAADSAKTTHWRFYGYPHQFLGKPEDMEKMEAWWHEAKLQATEKELAHLEKSYLQVLKLQIRDLLNPAIPADVKKAIVDEFNRLKERFGVSG